MGPYANAYYRAIVLANDMKHIHTHAVGNLFDNIHTICNEYYIKAADNSDTLAELALEKGEPVLNPSYAAQLLNISPTNQDKYEFLPAMNIAANSIKRFVDSLMVLREGTKDVSVQSLIDDMARYWIKEMHYKIRNRLIDGEN